MLGGVGGAVTGGLVLRAVIAASSVDEDRWFSDSKAVFTQSLAF